MIQLNEIKERCGSNFSPFKQVFLLRRRPSKKRSTTNQTLKPRVKTLRGHNIFFFAGVGTFFRKQMNRLQWFQLGDSLTGFWKKNHNCNLILPPLHTRWFMSIWLSLWFYKTSNAQVMTNQIKKSFLKFGWNQNSESQELICLFRNNL